MEQHTAPQETRFDELTPSCQVARIPTWAMDSKTTLAHGYGRLPENLAHVGWQPVAGPGSAQVQRSMTPSMRSLHQRIVRGEA
jgi:hypothetical protein